MAETCQDVIYECEAQGGHLAWCREPEPGILEFECIPDPNPYVPPPPTPTTPPPPAPKKRAIWPWALGGIGAVALGWYLLR